jgi:hypothetical protein
VVLPLSLPQPGKPLLLLTRVGSQQKLLEICTAVLLLLLLLLGVRLQLRLCKCSILCCSLGEQCPNIHVRKLGRCKSAQDIC